MQYRYSSIKVLVGTALMYNWCKILSLSSEQGYLYIYIGFPFWFSSQTEAVPFCVNLRGGGETGNQNQEDVGLFSSPGPVCTQGG